jgi:hypothetical protein
MEQPTVEDTIHGDSVGVESEEQAEAVEKQEEKEAIVY